MITKEIMYRKISDEISVNDDNTILVLTPNGRDDIQYYVPVAHVAGVKLKPANSSHRDASHKLIIDVNGSEGAMMLLYDDGQEAARCASALSEILQKFYA